MVHKPNGLRLIVLVEGSESTVITAIKNRSESRANGVRLWGLGLTKESIGA
jgi:hypothetical protein